MKAFVAWLAITLGVLGAFVTGYHFYLEYSPRKMLVVLDSSSPMMAAWDQIPSVLRQLEQQRYSEFALVTEKRSVHGWSEGFDLGNLRPFAPRNFSKLVNQHRYPELDEAEEVVFVTTAEEVVTEQFDQWTIIRLTH